MPLPFQPASARNLARSCAHAIACVLALACLDLAASCSTSDAGAPPISAGGNPDGSSDGPQSSGGSGGDASAACVPRTCQQLTAKCGSAPDGCGYVVKCGSCSSGETCGGGGPNLCGTNPCVPQTCAEAGANCGDVSDGCAGVMNCGGCEAPDTCGGAGKQHQCGHEDPGTGGQTGAGGSAGAGGAGGSSTCSLFGDVCGSGTTCCPGEGKCMACPDANKYCLMVPDDCPAAGGSGGGGTGGGTGGSPPQGGSAGGEPCGQMADSCATDPCCTGIGIHCVHCAYDQENYCLANAGECP